MNSGLISRASLAALLIGVLTIPAQGQGKAKGVEKKDEKPVAKVVQGVPWPKSR